MQQYLAQLSRKQATEESRANGTIKEDEAGDILGADTVEEGAQTEDAPRSYQ